MRKLRLFLWLPGLFVVLWSVVVAASVVKSRIEMAPLEKRVDLDTSRRPSAGEMEAKISVQGNGSFVATGSVTTSNSSNVVTGVGTLFLTELQIGDRLMVGGDSRPVTGITSDTTLTTSSGFSTSSSGVPLTVFPAILRLDNSAGASQVLVTDLGNMQLGSVFSGISKLFVYQANRFSGTSTTSNYSSGNLTVATSGSAAIDVGGVIALGGNRGTTAGGAVFAGLRGAKENGTDNDLRGYLGLYTVDDMNLFAERARLTSAGNLGVGTSAPTQKVEVNGGVRLFTAIAKPLCGPPTRGTFWVTQGETLTADTVEVCLKLADETLVWRTIF